jgi:hypothetical protein
MGTRALVRRRYFARVMAVTLLILGSGSARAAKHDLDLLKLCKHETPAAGLLNGQVPECSWVKRQTGGTITGIAFDGDAEARFRSLMSELGAVMAPRIVMPADTLGFAGFQISGEVGTTRISNSKPFWNGVEGVSTQNTSSGRPDAWLTTVGLFVRKGLWLPLPAVEVGGGVLHLVDSQMLAWQGYAKLALHEGFHDWPIPSFAVRGAASYLTGTDQVRMLVTSLDLIASKSFGILGTARVEPFGGWSFLFIKAHSGIVDATPSCDAYFARTAKMGDKLGEYCAESQRGTGNDSMAYFAFPDQDTIARQRFFAGLKIKFATVFMSAQYEFLPAGRSRDEKKPNGAKDGSGSQDGLSLSAGFDF